ncbi:hypothetical protein GYMLUDRAFT_50627 [Collybiopsis luxurians FD-317 M1]|uniref:Uncharacterized protein n=1 Tax=Collybiopsis luxurians FD-317 M1 TaxID=944289 RepID=A0A0D0C938_9AGAR|nr:hypothetical protein GYMLUDRAFT_50627 [Collybiopsis luxurians FD-317 M1]
MRRARMHKLNSTIGSDGDMVMDRDLVPAVSWKGNNLRSRVSRSVADTSAIPSNYRMKDNEYLVNGSEKLPKIAVAARGFFPAQIDDTLGWSSVVDQDRSWGHRRSVPLTEDSISEDSISETEGREERSLLHGTVRNPNTRSIPMRQKKGRQYNASHGPKPERRLAWNPLTKDALEAFNKNQPHLFRASENFNISDGKFNAIGGDMHSGVYNDDSRSNTTTIVNQFIIPDGDYGNGVSLPPHGRYRVKDFAPSSVSPPFSRYAPGTMDYACSPETSPRSIDTQNKTLEWADAHASEFQSSFGMVLSGSGTLTSPSLSSQSDQWSVEAETNGRETGRNRNIISSANPRSFDSGGSFISPHTHRSSHPHSHSHRLFYQYPNGQGQEHNNDHHFTSSRCSQLTPRPSERKRIHSSATVIVPGPCYTVADNHVYSAKPGGFLVIPPKGKKLSIVYA